MRKVSPYILLTLVLLSACGATNSILIDGRNVRPRIIELNAFLTQTIPGSAAVQTIDRDNTNTLIVLVNLSPENLTRWDVTAPLAKNTETRYTFYFRASRRIGNYVLAKTIATGDDLIPRVVLAFYADNEDTITWYNYSLEEAKESIDPQRLPIDPNVEYHREWNCHGPFYIERNSEPQYHFSNDPRYMVASITRILR